MQFYQRVLAPLQKKAHSVVYSLLRILAYLQEKFHPIADFFRRTFRFYKRIFSYFRQDLGYIIPLFVLIFSTVSFDLVLLYPIAIFVDLMSGQSPQGDRFYDLFLYILPKNPLGKIIGLAVLAVVLRALKQSIWTARMMLNSQIKYRGTTRVRKQLLDKFQVLGPAYYQGRSQGDSMYRVDTDAWGCFGVLDVFIGSAAAIGSLGGVFLKGWSMHHKLTLISMSIVPLLGVVNIFFGRRIQRAATNSKQTDAYLWTTLQRIFSSIRLIQAFRQEKHEVAQFGQVNKESMKRHMSLDWLEQLYPWGTEHALALVWALIFAYGGYHAYQTHIHPERAAALTSGQVTVFLGFLPMLFDPINWIVGFPTKAKIHAVSCERVFAVLDQPVEPAHGSTLAPLAVQPRTLQLRNVHFGYPKQATVLKGVHLDVEPGALVAIVGPSGAGKSTILQLLLRFADPSRGQLALDGVDFRAMRLADLRKHMALVPQDAGLFPATIWENITYGHHGATEKEVYKAAELSGCAEFIEKMPHQYETLVLEQASNLSGGQRQRIALARALLTQAPILVMDEPTSALDPVQKYVLIETLKLLKGQRTIVLVTHDTEVVSVCDQVFMLANGRLLPQKAYDGMLAWQQSAALPAPAQPRAKQLSLTSADTIRNQPR